MKRLLALLLVLSFVLVAAGCRTADAPATPAVDPAAEASGDDATATEGTDVETPDELAGDYKIGVVTGTVSQGEEEFQAAQQLVAKYGDRIVTATYPDNFTQETETVIANIAGIAADPDVKAIIVCQAVPGTSAAIDKVRETRPDMLFIAGVAAEAPEVIASKADIVLNIDDPGTGVTIPNQAQAQGAKTLIHYSFARHLSYETIAMRRAIMMETCKELGIEFVDVTAPDPTGDAGVAGAQQFILEDVPRQVEAYGKDTAFYSTNCSMMEPLIRSVAEQGAIFPQQCCPSPFHGYPAAFGIDVAGHAGDVNYMLEQTKAAVAAAGNSGRMSTWTVPVNMLMVEASAEYAMKFAEGEVGRQDMDAFAKIANEISECRFSKFESEGSGVLDNYYLIIADFYNF